MVRKIGYAALGLFVAAGTAGAQDAGSRSVDEKMWEILKARGVLTDAEVVELRAVKARLEAEADLGAKIDSRVDEMTAALLQDAPKLSYKPGTGFGFKTADGDFSLSIGGRLQTRFTYEIEDDDDGDLDAQDDLPNFTTPRARLWFKGSAFDPRLTYEFQFDVGGDLPKGSTSPSSVVTGVNFGSSTATSSASSFTGSEFLVELKDAYLNYEIAGKAFQIKTGQFKAPYSRHQMTSSGRQMFVDRAPTDRFFAPGRQKGANVWGMLGGEKDDLFEYYAGAFDGEGENAVNNDEGLMWVGRIAVNPFGGLAYSEADLRSEENRGKFLAALGVNGWYHQDDARGANNTDAWSVGADLTLAYQGFFVAAELHYRETDRSGPPNDMELTGWFAEAGYNFTAEWNVAIRYSETDWDEATGQVSAREYLVGVGYYWHEHNLKFQLDLGRTENGFLTPTSDDDDFVVRLQAQLVF
jgi:hypothetical protein